MILARLDAVNQNQLFLNAINGRVKHTWSRAKQNAFAFVSATEMSVKKRNIRDFEIQYFAASVNWKGGWTRQWQCRRFNRLRSQMAVKCLYFVPFIRCATAKNDESITVILKSNPKNSYRWSNYTVSSSPRETRPCASSGCSTASPSWTVSYWNLFFYFPHSSLLDPHTPNLLHDSWLHGSCEVRDRSIA